MSNPLLAALLLALGRGSAGGHKKQKVGKLVYVAVTALWQLGLFVADIEYDPKNADTRGADTRGGSWFVRGSRFFLHSAFL